MTKEVQEHLQWLRSAVSYANDERCRLALHGIEQEIERLHAELAAISKAVEIVCDRKPGAAANAVREDYPEIAALIDGTFLRLEKELEQAKAWRKCQTHGEINGAIQWGCPDCVAQLRRELEQAKERFRGFMPEEIKRYCTMLESQLAEAKERERQLQYDLSQPNPNVFVPSTTTDGTGNSEAFRELSSLSKVKELESANALAQQENTQMREALTSIHQRWIDGPAEWHMMAWAMNSDAEAALTVPPARPVATGRLSQGGTTANTDMTKVTNRPPDNEREAWLDGRARVEPEKEKS